MFTVPSYFKKPTRKETNTHAHRHTQTSTEIFYNRQMRLPQPETVKNPLLRTKGWAVSEDGGYYRVGTHFLLLRCDVSKYTETCESGTFIGKRTDCHTGM